ncbi:Cytochrome P450 85A [Symbiodinium microadriaticum]|uniref:Cytochrome P450 85A n=1 Tax=Symbiodinium microadriaticum TaxID=2951 RepID=A0A1Q9EHZ0_SYMMI|nr:Cytochrome P450 85A [Symbiodinium microadriaticum]
MGLSRPASQGCSRSIGRVPVSGTVYRPASAASLEPWSLQDRATTPKDASTVVELPTPTKSPASLAQFARERQRSIGIGSLIELYRGQSFATVDTPKAHVQGKTSPRADLAGLANAFVETGRAHTPLSDLGSTKGSLGSESVRSMWQKSQKPSRAGSKKPPWLQKSTFGGRPFDPSGMGRDQLMQEAISNRRKLKANESDVLFKKANAARALALDRQRAEEKRKEQKESLQDLNARRRLDVERQLVRIFTPIPRPHEHLPVYCQRLNVDLTVTTRQVRKHKGAKGEPILFVEIDSVHQPSDPCSVNMAALLSFDAAWARDLSRELLSKLTWPRVCALASAGVVARVLWSHYGILLRRRLPTHDLGLPLVGHTFEIKQESLEGWVNRVLKDKQAYLAHYFYSHTVLLRHELYMKHVHRAELDGKLCPFYPRGLSRLIGENSIIVLPGGKGHHKHKRLRGKLLSSLGPQYVLSIVPEIMAMIRQMLDGLVKDTERQGYAKFQPAATNLAARVSVLPIAAGLEDADQQRFQTLLDTALLGLYALPINLSRFSAHGRALIARHDIDEIVSKAMASPNKHRQNIVADLAKDSKDGHGFTKEEISDTLFSLLVAGKMTTSEAFPFLLVQLYKHPSWIPRIASESLEMTNPEENSATLRFVREAMRLKPPAGAFRRVNRTEDVDLGEHGVVPRGCPMAIDLRADLKDMGQTFDPERWLTEAKDKFTVFGGNQPHECIGKHLALVELQLFARILCREYNFQVMSMTEVVNPGNPINRTYKDGCRVKFSKQ